MKRSKKYIQYNIKSVILIDAEIVEEYKPSLFTTIVPMTPR